MTEVMNTLFTWLASSDYSQYVGVIIFISYTLSHILQYLPVKWTTKIPNWVMITLNAISAKHGANRSAITDMSGNKIVNYVSKVL